MSSPEIDILKLPGGTMLSAAEAAKYLGVSPTQVRVLCSFGKLASANVGVGSLRKRRRIPVSELRKFMRTQIEQQASEDAIGLAASGVSRRALVEYH